MDRGCCCMCSSRGARNPNRIAYIWFALFSSSWSNFRGPHHSGQRCAHTPSHFTLARTPSGIPSSDKIKLFFLVYAGTPAYYSTIIIGHHQWVSFSQMFHKLHGKLNTPYKPASLIYFSRSWGMDRISAKFLDGTRLNETTPSYLIAWSENRHPLIVRASTNCLAERKNSTYIAIVVVQWRKTVSRALCTVHHKKAKKKPLPDSLFSHAHRATVSSDIGRKWCQTVDQKQWPPHCFHAIFLPVCRINFLSFERQLIANKQIIRKSHVVIVTARYVLLASPQEVKIILFS